MSVKTHLGVYAVILDAAGERILLIKKRRGPYTGLLDLPGGTIEAEELLEEALRREVLEETGCVVVSLEQLRTESIIYKTLKHIGILYKAVVMGDPRIDGDGQDSDGAM